MCAALPVIYTLKDLLRTGDKVHRIRAVVSGSLSYIFNQMNQGCSFAESVSQAHKLGYTEPDPRDDLSGADVARKMVCLARELGFAATMDDVACVDLVPKKLQQISVTDFLQQLPDHATDVVQQIEAVQHQAAAIAYVGELDCAGKIKVQMQALSAEDPMISLKQTDNMVVFHSDRYDEQPLVIRGPGAGAAVTASGVFSDLLRLVTYIRN